MGDVPVLAFPVDWLILPPHEVRRGDMFTVVARFEDHVEPQILEAFMVKDLNSSRSDDGVDGSNGSDDNRGLEIEEEAMRAVAFAERFYGSSQYTGPGFNNDGSPGTYVWFNIRARLRGNHKFQFRLTWWVGHHLFGASDTFEVNIRNRFGPVFYCTEDQDLLALLEPSYYDPTPIELMDVNMRT